jgi:hypothetical protein
VSSTIQPISNCDTEFFAEVLSSERLPIDGREVVAANMTSFESLRSCRLLALPEELLLCTIEQIDDHDALRNLAATCSYLQRLTEPFIWRSLLVVRGVHADYIARALGSRPERASFVQDLAIRYKEDNGDGIEFLEPFIYQMRRLRQLHLESPCPNNYGGWRNGASEFSHWTKIDYTRLFEAACNGKSLSPPLPHLQSGELLIDLLWQVLIVNICSHTTWS